MQRSAKFYSLGLSALLVIAGSGCDDDEVGGATLDAGIVPDGPATGDVADATTVMDFRGIDATDAPVANEPFVKVRGG